MFGLRRAKPSSRTTYPAMAGDQALLVIGDIHGRLDLLERLHGAIDRALEGGTSAPLEIYLGDYVDRGPDSAGVIERLLGRARRRPLVLLRGNHEVMFARTLAGSLELREWARYGALDTLASYGLEPSSLDLKDQAECLARLRAAVPETHQAFLAALRDFHREGDYFFAHAGIRPGKPLDRQSPEDLQWIRGEFLNDKRHHGAIIVHGHTPVDEPELLPNRVNIDTGAFRSGRLTCLRIDGIGLSWFDGATAS